MPDMDEQTAEAVLDEMERDGLVEYVVENGQRMYRLTAKGMLVTERLIATDPDVAAEYVRLVEADINRPRRD